ncbi:MAG: DUF1573 domain-containing protein [Pirellulales bacterium]|nr:DUF1573 domain-containing protein [Pirellulales bacterium]
MATSPSDPKKATEPQPKEVSLTAEIHAERRRLPRVTLKMGSFLPGTTVNCKVTIRNASERGLTFSRVVTGCACLSVEPQKADLPPGSKATIGVVVRTPAHPSDSTQSATFVAYDGGLAKFQMRMEYHVSGVVGFKATSLRVRVPKGSKSYKLDIPFFADELSPKALIDLEKSKALEKLSIDLDYKSRILRVDIPEESVEKGRITGEIRLKNIETGSHDAVLLDIDLEDAVAVYPTVLRFARVEREGKESFSAKATVINRAIKAGEKRAMNVSFSRDGTPLASRLLRSNGRVSTYEVYLSRDLAVNDGELSDRTIQARVQALQLNQTLDLSYRFEASSQLSVKSNGD